MKMKKKTPMTIKKSLNKKDKGKIIIIDEAQEKKDKDNFTFQNTYNYLVNHGWIRITPREYNVEKHMDKRQTARIGINGYFKLNKTNEEIHFRKKISD